jgi:hypothetical protein
MGVGLGCQVCWLGRPLQRQYTPHPLLLNAQLTTQNTTHTLNNPPPRSPDLRRLSYVVEAPGALDEALWSFTGLANLRSLEVVARGPLLLPDQLRVRWLMRARALCLACVLTWGGGTRSGAAAAAEPAAGAL